jgi:hypothetical protein
MEGRKEGRKRGTKGRRKEISHGGIGRRREEREGS